MSRRPCTRWAWLAVLLVALSAPLRAQDDEGLDALDHLRLADALFRREAYATAAEEYQTFVADNPQHEKAPAACLAWASCYPDDPAKAMAVYARLIKEYPASEEARDAITRQALLLLQANRVQDAADLVNGADVSTGTDTWQEAVLYYRGVSADRLGNPAAARENFTPLSQRPLDPKYPYRAYARLHLAFLDRAQNPAAAGKLLAALAAEPSVPDDVREEGLFYLGEIARNSKDLDAAKSSFTQLLQRYPGGEYAPPARVRLAWVDHQQGNHKDVIQLLTPAPDKILPDTPEVLYLRSDSQMKLKLYDAARAGFETLAAKYPDSEYRDAAEMGILEALYESRDYAACAERATQVLQMDVADSVKQETQVLLARCHLARGDWAPAAQVLQVALDQYGNQWEYYGAALAELARAYSEAGDSAKAAVVYRRLAAARPDERGVYLLHAAEEEMRAQGYDRALKDYSQAYETAQDNAEVAPLALLGMVEIYIRQQDYRDALPHLDTFIQRFPTHSYIGRALYLRGSLRYRLDDDKQLAIADLEKAIASGNLEQENFAKLLLGSAYWEANQEDKALKLFAQVLDSPDVRASLAPQVVNAIGERYIERNDLVAAKRAYQVLVDSEDETVRVAGYIGLGKVAFAAEKWDEAIDFFSRARRQTTRPEDAEYRAIALAYLGESYRRLGDNDRALLELQESVKLRSEDVRATAMARNGLAHVYAAQGDTDKALRFTMLTYLLEDDPIYSPRAMLLEIRLLLDKGDTQGASTTLRELDKRYPIALSAYRNQAENKDLFVRLDALRK